MTAKYYEATIKLEDDTIVQHRFWSTFDRMCKNNLDKAGRDYLRCHKDYKGDLQIMKIKKLTYGDLQIGKEERAARMKEIIG